MSNIVGGAAFLPLFSFFHFSPQRIVGGGGPRKKLMQIYKLLREGPAKRLIFPSLLLRPRRLKPPKVLALEVSERPQRLTRGPQKAPFKPFRSAIG